METADLRNRLFFFIVFGVLIILTFVMLKTYLTVIILSLFSVIMLKPVYDFYAGRQRVRGRTWLAASLTLITFFLILIIPLYFILHITITQLSGVFEQLASLDLDAVTQGIRQALEGLPLLGRLVEDGDTLEGVQPFAGAVAQALADFAVALGASLPTLIIQGVLFVILVASLLPVYDVLIPQLEAISPLGSEVSELYNRKITAMVKSLVLGVLLIAIIQGAAMGLFFWLAGLPYVFLLTMLSMLLAMIPMVGISWLVIAIAILSVLTGNYSQAIIVLFGFYGVVNWIDVLLRPRFLSQEASLNFALFMLSIFGGLAWAGVMGLFYGPIIMLLLVTTIQVYAEKYAKEDTSALDRMVKNLHAGRRGGEPAA
jgi:predicted PurR-regulated permease PerM